MYDCTINKAKKWTLISLAVAAALFSRLQKIELSHLYFKERRQQTQEEMGAMEDEMRRAEELIKLRKEQQEKQELGSRRCGCNFVITVRHIDVAKMLLIF